MIFPRISNYVVYNYEGENVIVWQQDLFFKVYIRTLPNSDNEGGKYSTVNWWKFMLKAKISFKLEDNEKI